MKKTSIPLYPVEPSIQLLRGQKVLMDFTLAGLYGVTTKSLNQAVQRNRERFPEDFMFRLTKEEARVLRSQFVTSSSEPAGSENKKHGGPRYLPYAFTEQGVAMLSSVLRSERAVKVNIAIMRAFVKLRETLETNRELGQRFAQLEKRVGQHDAQITAIIDAIRQLMAPGKKSTREIGFHVRETPPRYGTRKRR